MRLFISHAWEDKALALTLFDLPDFIKPWIDIRELVGGDTLDSAITLAIDESHLFVVLLSRHSIHKSWVLKEVTWALEREAQKDRVFILPVVIDADVQISEAGAPINTLDNRIYIDGSDQSEKGIASTHASLKETLFRWACDWINTVEPAGDSNARFVRRVEQHILDYQTALFSVKALLAWPLEVLRREESKQHMIHSQQSYSELTDSLMPALSQYEEEIRWRFGMSAQRSFIKLSTFIRNDVFHGAAFAMNDIVESVNAYESVIQHHPDKLAEAREIQQARIASLEQVLDDLIRQTADFFQTIK